MIHGQKQEENKVLKLKASGLIYKNVLYLKPCYNIYCIKRNK